MSVLVTLMSRLSMSRTTGVCLWVRPMPMWCMRPARRSGDGPGFVDAVVSDPVVRPGAGSGWSCLGKPGVGDGWCGSLEAAVGSPVVVVFVDEAVDQGL